MSDLDINGIFAMASVQNKKQEYKKDARSQYGDMIKIEKKKKEIAHKKEKVTKKEKKAHMQKIQKDKEEVDFLRTAGYDVDNTTRAMDLYKTSDLKASDLTDSDI